MERDGERSMAAQVGGARSQVVVGDEAAALPAEGRPGTDTTILTRTAPEAGGLGEAEALNGARLSATRRYDLDWLRVIATGLVFLFHSARAYDLGGWHLKNPQTSLGMEVWAQILGQVIMPLMFVISGISTSYALGAKGGKFLGSGLYVWSCRCSSVSSSFRLTRSTSNVSPTGSIRVRSSAGCRPTRPGSTWAATGRAISPGWGYTSGICWSSSCSHCSPCRYFDTCSGARAAYVSSPRSIVCWLVGACWRCRRWFSWLPTCCRWLIPMGWACGLSAAGTCFSTSRSFIFGFALLSGEQVRGALVRQRWAALGCAVAALGGLIVLSFAVDRPDTPAGFRYLYPVLRVRDAGLSLAGLACRRPPQLH